MKSGNIMIISLTILSVFSFIVPSNLVAITQLYDDIEPKSCDNHLYSFEEKTQIHHQFVTMQQMNTCILNEYEPSPKPRQTCTIEEYDWRSCGQHSYVTPVKNQKDCGSCWVFAAIGVLESVIKIREGCAQFSPDLSEQYVLSCLPVAGSCSGGYAYNALRYMMEETPEGNYHNGALPESCFPYGADDDISCDEKCSTWEEKLIPLLDCGYWIPDGSIEDRDKIKTQIIQSGPIACSIYASDEFIRWGCTNHDSKDFYQNNSSVIGTNHVVMMIGWKDDKNLTRGGYWICKNSWGTEWGYEGYFNIEYGTLNIDGQNSMITWVDYDPLSFDWDPIVNINGPYYGYIVDNIFFNGSNSFDPDGDDISFRWDFGDGTTSNSKFVNHSFRRIGSYDVTLNVTDSHNHSSISHSKAYIQKENKPPRRPTIYGQLIGKIDVEYHYRIFTSDLENNEVYFSIFWDDVSEELFGPISSGEEILVCHKWDNSGIKCIRTYSYDKFGSKSPMNYFFILIVNSGS